MDLLWKTLFFLISTNFHSTVATNDWMKHTKVVRRYFVYDIKSNRK